MAGGPHVKVSVSSKEETFPTRLAFSVWLVQFYNGVQYAEIFTLAVYLVRRFEGEGASEQKVGQLAGLLAAASSFAVGVAAWPWGLLSDRIGRKKVILIGNCATSAFIIMFSTAKAYWVALLSRLLAGLLDGSLVMTKAMVGESCSPSMQGRVMSYLALGDAVGNILGPAMGGLLSDPCRFSFLKGTSVCSEGSLLVTSPFLLPCGLTAALGLITTVVNVISMEETLPRLKRRGGHEYEPLQRQQSGLRESRRSLDLASAATDTESLSELISEAQLLSMQTEKGKEKDAGYHASDEGSAPDGGSLQRQSSGGSVGSIGKPRAVAIEMQSTHDGMLRPHDSVQSTCKLPEESSGKQLDVRWAENSEVAEDSEEEKHLLGRSTSKDVEDDGEQVKPAEEPHWWRNKPLLMTLVVTAWMLSIAKYNDELGPVFASAPVNQGGLGMSLDRFAIPLSFGGVVLTLFALFVYPRLQRKVGLKMTCSLGLLVGIPGDLLLPTAALFRWQPIIEQAIIFLAIAITKVTTQTCFTSSMVIINSLAPRSELGSVNGVRMMFAAFGRSIGPLLGGVIWGFSASLVNIPGHHYLGFVFASGALIGCWALHHSIPIHIPG